MKVLKILASNPKHFRIYDIFKKWQIGAGPAPADILNTRISYIFFSDLENSAGYVSWLKSSKMASKFP